MNKKKSKKQEYNNFASIAKEWWEPNGKFKILHKILPIRIEYILNKIDYNKIISHANKLKVPINLNKYFLKKDVKQILKYMKSDKKNNSSKINLVLIKKIGAIILELRFNENKIKKFLKKELIY